jgi:prepilin-type N-terminal cleavage/methylation domain-containing protein
MQKNKKAFTLSEILIALGIFSIILSVFLYNSKTVVKNNANAKLTKAAYKILQVGVGDYIAKNGKITDSKDLCNKMIENLNTVGTSNCTQTATTSSDFKSITENFTLSNGMKFYNFGGAVSTASLINQLTTKENQLAELTPSDEGYTELQEEIASLKEELKNYDSYYTIFVDIDGSSRKSKYGDDVVAFLVDMYGEVLPYDTIADNKKYITAGYKYKNGSNNWVWVSRNETFRTAICKSGAELQNKSYCNGISVDSTNCGTNLCTYVIIK